MEFYRKSGNLYTRNFVPRKAVHVKFLKLRQGLDSKRRLEYMRELIFMHLKTPCVKSLQRSSEAQTKVLSGKSGMSLQTSAGLGIIFVWFQKQTTCSLMRVAT